MHCLSLPFWQATSVQNVRIFTVHDHMSVAYIACFFSSTIYDTHAKIGQNQLKLEMVYINKIQ